MSAVRDHAITARNRVDTQFRFGEVEDEPATAGIGVGRPSLSRTKARTASACAE